MVVSAFELLLPMGIGTLVLILTEALLTEVFAQLCLILGLDLVL